MPRKRSSRSTPGPPAENGSGRSTGNGPSRKTRKGRSVHRVALEEADIEILLEACRQYVVSLPSYLASVQEDVARTEALVKKLGKLAERG